MTVMKRTKNQPRRGLCSLLPVVCALLLLYNAIPAMMEDVAADCYTSSGKEAVVQPVTFRHEEGRVNINTATLAELDALPGVGPAIAQAIIDEREANGPFFYPEDLMDAKGVGAGKFAAISDLITTGE